MATDEEVSELKRRVQRLETLVEQLIQSYTALLATSEEHGKSIDTVANTMADDFERRAER